MKHLKRILLGIFCVVFAFSAVAFSACDEGTNESGINNIGNGGSGSAGGTEGSTGDTEGTEGSGNTEGGGNTETPVEPAGPLTVTIGDYDAEKGTVSVSAPQDGEAYALGELVTVTAEGKEGYESSAIFVDGVVRERIASTYTFGLTKSVTVTAAFAASTAELPEVTFENSPSVTSFGLQFRGHWKSQSGELFIGEKTLSYKGTAVTSVYPKNSEAEQVYNFSVDRGNYSLSWARTDYSVGCVIDVLNIDTGAREDFLPDPLPTEKVVIAEKYYGEWTCYEGNSQSKLNISANGLVYDGTEIKDVVDGGYYERTNNELQMVIGTNIYFFLQNNRLNILYWNGEEGANCPVVDDCVEEHFFNNLPPVKQSLPQSLRGTWKSADGSKTLVVTAETLTIDDQEVKAGSLGGIILTYQEGGKDKEAELYAGSDYIMQVTISTYGSDGLVSSWEFEYYFKEGRPAVTVDSSLNGTWTSDSSTLSIGDTVTLDGETVHVIEAGESRENGFVYFVEIGGKLYEFFAENSAEEEDAEPVWSIQLSNNEGFKTYTRSNA